jgi:hypothetical protein
VKRQCDKGSDFNPGMRDSYSDLILFPKECLSEKGVLSVRFHNHAGSDAEVIPVLRNVGLPIPAPMFLSTEFLKSFMSITG